MPPGDDPAVAALLNMVGRCITRHESTMPGDIDRMAWMAAYQAGVTLLEEFLRALRRHRKRGGELRLLLPYTAKYAFDAAVGRAVAYRALYVTRNALTLAAVDFGLFPIGGRQPVPNSPRGWSRFIGSAVYRFEVTEPRPLDGAPVGMVVAVRIDPVTGQRSERHAFPLSPRDPDRHAALIAELRRI